MRVSFYLVFRVRALNEGVFYSVVLACHEGVLFACLRHEGVLSQVRVLADLMMVLARLMRTFYTLIVKD